MPDPKLGSAYPTGRQHIAIPIFVGITALIVAGRPSPGAAGAGECLLWTKRTPISPPARFAYATAFDEKRGVLVLFGGAYETRLNDTWEFDGARWRLRSTSGPSPRDYHAMVYDRNRGVTVLFGGSSSLNAYGDTWEWDGTTWTLRATTGPSTRAYHALAYDSVRRVTVLFGGLTSVGGTNSELWEWDGESWTQRNEIGPGRRFLHAMAFDEKAGKTVLFGGSAGPTYFDDMWTWDGTAWQEIQTEGPSARATHSMSYDAARAVVVLHDGFGPGGRFLDTWEWNGQAWSRRAASAPSYGPMVFDSIRSATVMIGLDSRLWRWDGMEWTEHLLSPTRRWGHALVYDSLRKVSVLFGGEDFTTEPNTILGDTWEWNGDTWSRKATTGPPPRVFHAMAFDRARGVVVLHGGFDFAVEYSDTWEWDGQSWTLRDDSQNLLLQRWAHSMDYDTQREVTVLLGGEGPAARGTFEWDGSEWTQKPALWEPIAVRYGAMAYDAERGVSVYYGGENNYYTYEWDGSEWYLRTFGVPPVRRNHAMVYDESLDLTLLTGGYGAVFYDETWAWDGTSWSLMTNLGPGSRHHHAIAFDSARAVTVLFGGQSDMGLRGDTWELSPGAFALDADGDCDVDLGDFSAFQNCVGADPLPPECARFDADANGIVDIEDAIEIFNTLHGPIR